MSRLTKLQKELKTLGRVITLCDIQLKNLQALAQVQQGVFLAQRGDGAHLSAARKHLRSRVHGSPDGSGCLLEAHCYCF